MRKLPKLPPAYVTDMLAGRGAEKPAPEQSDVAPVSANDPRARAYSDGVLRSLAFELAELGRLPKGAVDEHGRGWEAATFESACRVIELTNAPWSTLTPDQAAKWFAEHAPTDAEWTQKDVSAKFQSAMKTVGTKALELPKDRLGGVVLDEDDDDDFGGDDDDFEGTDEPSPLISKRELAKHPEEAHPFIVANLGRKYAAELVDQLEGNVMPSPATLARRRSELVDQPSPAPIIEGIVGEGELTLLVALPGSGKSVMTTGMSASVAEGTDWLGHKTQQRTVCYVDAEDYDRGNQRLAAWEAHYNKGRPVSDKFILMPGGWSLSNHTQSARLREYGAENGVGLWVFDTLGALSGVQDEDRSAQMQIVMNNIRHIIGGVPGAAALILHHPSKSDPENARGSLATVGAVNNVLFLSQRPGGVLHLKRGKTRNGESNVRLGTYRFVKAADGVTIEGHVETAGEAIIRGNTNAALALAVFGREFRGVGASKAEWRAVLTRESDELTKPMARQSADSAIARLQSSKSVVLQDGRYLLPEDADFISPTNPFN